jgi:hypothetical protein
VYKLAEIIQIICAGRTAQQPNLNHLIVNHAMDFNVRSLDDAGESITVQAVYEYETFSFNILMSPYISADADI